MVVEITLLLVFMLIIFIAMLISPGSYYILHSWIRETDPEIIYDKMYGLSYLSNYIPYMAALSKRMRGFYSLWSLISLLWTLIFAGWFASVLLINIGHGGFACITTLIVLLGIYPLMTWGSTKYMRRKYRESKRE